MKVRSWWPLVALAAVVAALAAWVYQRPDPRRGETYALSHLKAAEVRRIRLERLAPATEAAAPASSPSSDAGRAHDAYPELIELERRPEGWRIVAPFTARADAFQVERLLSSLNARSAARFPASQLDRYGLERPQARVTFDDQSFAFGNVNTATREQYVLTGGAVYAIPLAQRAAVPRDAEALISKALFAPGEAPVRIELPGLTAALEDGVWKITPAADGASADERNAWAERWRQALAVRAARHDGRPPQAQMTVQLKGGPALTLSILQRKPELVLLRPDEGVQYHFFAETAKRLLSPPAGGK